MLRNYVLTLTRSEARSLSHHTPTLRLILHSRVRSRHTTRPRLTTLPRLTTRSAILRGTGILMPTVCNFRAHHSLRGTGRVWGVSVCRLGHINLFLDQINVFFRSIGDLVLFEAGAGSYSKPERGPLGLLFNRALPSILLLSQVNRSVPVPVPTRPYFQHSPFKPSVYMYTASCGITI